MAYTVLIAEDDSDIVNILKLYLESSGYRVLTASDGNRAYQLIETEQIHLAIFDVMMPEIDGFTLTKYVRQIKSIPILILTAKIGNGDKILGLNLGADDYLTKPFDPLEVVARVNANIRRCYAMSSQSSSVESGSLLSLGELEMDLDKYVLRKNSTEIPLTPIEFKLLRFMMKSPGRVYTKSQLCEAVNGEYYENYENAIAVHISHLRDKIEDDPKNAQYIKNVRGVGYKIEKAK